MCSGLVYFVTLLAITALFFGGQYEAVGVTGLLVFGASTAVGLLKTQGGKLGSGKKKVRLRR